MKCALCGFTLPNIGGRVSDYSGTFDLCHLDHSGGRTCYEKVSSTPIPGSFKQRILTLQKSDFSELEAVTKALQGFLSED